MERVFVWAIDCSVVGSNVTRLKQINIDVEAGKAESVFLVIHSGRQRADPL